MVLDKNSLKNSTKYLGFVLWGPLMFALNFMSIYSVVVEIFCWPTGRLIDIAFYIVTLLVGRHSVPHRHANKL